MSRPNLPTVRLLHTSDVHLDGTPERLASFSAVVDVALEREVDVMIVAGDFFDHVWMLEDDVADSIRELERLSCPTVMISGNHDCLDETSIYHRVDLADAGPHIHFFDKPDGEWILLEDLHLAIWGRGIESHHPGFRPLDSYVPAYPDHWRVAVTHGFYVPPGETTDRSSPISAEEIGALGCDYLALGHWHRFLDVSFDEVQAFYSGTPSSGSAGIDNANFPSVNVVELHPTTGVSVERVAIPISAPVRVATDR